MSRIAVIGGGAWGTGLAQVSSFGGETLLWAREAEVVESVNAAHENAAFLPGVKLSPEIRATSDLAAAVSGAGAVLLVVPAQYLRATATALAPHLAAGVPVVLCAKGIEASTGALMTEVAADTLPGRPLAVLSGPSFAHEVAKGLPAALLLASADPGLAEAMIARLGRPAFRLYVSDDPVGAEIGGAVKNVLAIAAGIVEGAGLGDNARAAMITRGLAELIRLGTALGARPQTLTGLAGLGDLVLTCTGASSRNHRLGVALGQGKTVAEATAGSRAVVEGVASARPVRDRAAKAGVEMPLVEAVDDVVNAGLSVADAVQRLLGRPTGAENWR
jgi:glycerol-3-phosphate dehydrogenase (NAD(P)+)